MKAKIFAIAGVLMLLALTSCSKGKFCKCTLDNQQNEVRVINVDHGTSCKKMTQIGIEEQYTPEGDSVPSLRRFMVDMTCEKIKAKDYDRSDE